MRPPIGAISDTSHGTCTRLDWWGTSCLGDAELVALVLGRSREGLEAARRLLAHYGSLAALSEASPRGIAKVGRVGLSRARRLVAALALSARLEAVPRALPVIRSPEDVDCRYRAMARAHVESVVVVGLNARGGVLREWVVARGSTSWCAVTPRDVFSPLVREAATHFILVHAHPSGDPTPSSQDIAFTRRIARASELLGLRLRDHVIVASGGFRSLAREGVVE